ncbi:hypothetical protein HOLleu_37591 [Holothuria leucospilota]|uniref:Uncharacterized protein n=1 Tax=Holothuria leucospilota TaxID=206669 RepID=A0A9Q0YL55_HOLLE|nr:hypothetical protein HOLleu_37591 [Holothuria leucospilota]
MRDRDYYEKLARKDKSQATWQDYKVLRNEVSRALKRAKASYVSQNLSENTGNIWQILKKVVPGSRDSLPNSICKDGRVITENNEIATEFNNFFTSVAHSIVPTNPSHDFTSSNNDRMPSDCIYDIPYVTEYLVTKAIDKMSCTKATGVDDISCKILKIAKSIIVPSLTEIINLSIRTKSVPNLWIQAKVTPIFKSGD